MDLMQDSEEFSVDFFFSEKLLKILNLSEAEHVFSSSTQEIFEQIKDGNYDLIIIGTAHRYFNTFLKISTHFKTAVIVHNLNFAKLSGTQLLLKILKKDFVYRLKLLLQEGLFNSSKVYKNSINLLLDQVLADNKQYQFLPLFYHKSGKPHKKPAITVVIPGAVSQSRRDYRLILEKLKDFKRNVHLHIVFLGKAEGQELGWLQQFEKDRPTQITMKYFTEKVPQEEFDWWMVESDVLWCPVQKETEFFSGSEIYGKTKMTGNIGDAIKYGRMAIFPSDYQSDYRFIVPQEENIENQLIDLARNSIYDFREKYSKMKVSAELHHVLNSLIKT